MAVGGWLLTLDLEKAYDRLRWPFIRETLEDLGILQNIVELL